MVTTPLLPTDGMADIIHEYTTKFIVSKKSETVMPVSMEQWRASVGSINAAHLHNEGYPWLFFFALFSPGAGPVTNMHARIRQRQLLCIDIDITHCSAHVLCYGQVT